MLLSFPLHAKDLGVYGATFTIIEEDLLAVIKAKIQKMAEQGILDAHQKQIQEQVKKRLQRPTPIPIEKTKKERTFFYDPSITVPYDLKDHKERVFFKAGTKVNPLDTHSLKYALLFIDGDDKEHIAWAFRHKQNLTKIILVNGAPFELMDQFSTPIYFDQGGILVKKFGIQQVPARVIQSGKLLKIEEVYPLEGKE